MGLTVYGNLLSQPARSVALFCKVANIPHTEKILDIGKGEHKTEAYLAINPAGMIPCIVDDEFKLSECMAILKYLARKYKVADHWYPADLKLQAKVNEYLDWQHAGLRRVGVDICVNMVFAPMFFGRPTDETKLATDLEKFEKALTLIEKAYLGDKKYLASNEVSIADICALSELMQVITFQRTDVLAGHPKLKAWKDRVVGYTLTNSGYTLTNTMGLTVYGNLLSPPARSVALFCKVAKIAHTVKILDMSKGEHKSEAYLAINPAGLVPCIVDDKFKLSECMAILKYLPRKYKVADHWYPKDLKLQAKVNEYLDWHHAGLRRVVVDIFVNMTLGPMISGKPTDETKLATDLEKFDKTLTLFEKAFLGDKKYLASNEVSIADICALSELMQILPFQRTDLLAGHPNIKAWKDRVVRKLNPVFDEVHKGLMELKAGKGFEEVIQSR